MSFAFVVFSLFQPKDWRERASAKRPIFVGWGAQNIINGNRSISRGQNKDCRIRSKTSTDEGSTPNRSSHENFRDSEPPPAWWQSWV